MRATRISHRLSLAALAVALASAACADHPRENVSSRSAGIVLGTPATDHPEAVAIDLYQAGVLQAYCSGSVVAPYVVLTAGHCVDGFDAWQVTAPYASGGQSAASSNGEMLDWKGNGETLNAVAHDVAVLVLATPIRLSSYPVLATSPVADGTPIVNVGRVQDGTLSSTALYESMPLRAYGATTYGWPLDYLTMDAVQSGDSGGPDYWTSPTGPVLVAINSGATKNDYYEVLTRIDLVAPWITSQIAAYPTGLPYAPPDAGTDASPDASADASVD
jgi:secreted trypsin-like serine protease